ncbi:hypothetical protein JKF63_03829 [Porcisia hertigi]|uniref:Uncharacterized protein n=1 Tax=Porcisia hertigi TaxID=2761500 RepID=A0A836I6E9_9TRYP|nr:hypothetical protein JKF63_03829 [Porcisia hertigi]
MRTSKVLLCTPLVHPWVSQYLARVGVAPDVSASELVYKGTSPLRSRDVDTPAISVSEAAVRQRQYREARKQLLGALRVQPFSHATIFARAGVFSSASPEDIFDLRGLRSADYDCLDAPRLLCRARPHSEACSSSVDPLPSESQFVAGRPARSTMHSSPIASSVASAAEGPTVQVVSWPTVAQMTKALERRIMDYRHLWRAAKTFAGDHLNAREKRENLESPTSASHLPSGLFFSGGSRLVVLATLPHTLVYSIVEYSILHAWHGEAHVYPMAKLPSPGVDLALQDRPLLRAEDVTSLQWDRAQAANFLVSVLQQPVVQKDLRQRLWGAAQNYHRDIMRKLESLAVKTGGKGVREDVTDEWCILLDHERGGAEPLSLSLQALRDDLFSFDEILFFLRRPLASSYSSSRQHRVECQPLRSTHFFRFVTSRPEVAAAFTARPRSNIFDFSFRSSPPDGKTGGRTSGALATLSTRDKLWLLLSEMARLRYLVAYLLNFEVMLRDVRNSHTPPYGEQPTPREGDRALFLGSRGIQQADEQDAKNAKCIEAILYFLDIRIHTRLATCSHHHRFLRHTQVRHGERFSMPEMPSPPREATDVDIDVSRKACRHATVQSLYSAFSKALNGSTAPPSPSPSSSSPAPPSAFHEH